MSYRDWTAEPARTWVSRRWSRTLFSERRRGPAGGQTWSSVDLGVVVFILVSLFFFSSPIRGPVVVLWLFFVWSPGLWTAVCKDAGTAWKKEIKDLAFFFFCESILCLSGFTFLYFWILYSCGNQMDTLFLWLESSWTDLVRHTHEHAAMCWARSKDCLALGEQIKLPVVIHTG